jgi:S1-C subfamily serine protease
MVSEVLGDSAAARAGIVAGDILLTLDERVLAGVDDLHRLLTLERANKIGKVSVLRGAHIESIAIRPDADQ